MSNFSYDPNPYAATDSFSNTPMATQPRFPVFCKVMFIISLVFCCLRLPLVLLSMVGYAAMLQQENDPLLPTVLPEILTGIGIVAFGITGNAFLLARKNWAVMLGYLTVACTIGSILVVIWQVPISIDKFPVGSPQRTAYIMGASFATIVRLVILGLYVTALVKFSDWARRRPSQSWT